MAQVAFTCNDIRLTLPDEAQRLRLLAPLWLPTMNIGLLPICQRPAPFMLVIAPGAGRWLAAAAPIADSPAFAQSMGRAAQLRLAGDLVAAVRRPPGDPNGGVRQRMLATVATGSS